MKKKLLMILMATILCFSAVPAAPVEAAAKLQAEQKMTEDQLDQIKDRCSQQLSVIQKTDKRFHISLRNDDQNILNPCTDHQGKRIIQKRFVTGISDTRE